MGYCLLDFSSTIQIEGKGRKKKKGQIAQKKRPI